MGLLITFTRTDWMLIGVRANRTSGSTFVNKAATPKLWAFADLLAPPESSSCPFLEICPLFSTLETDRKQALN
jgi:hypothetical protein